MSLKVCPKCGKKAVARVEILEYARAADPDDDTTIYYSEDPGLGAEFPECQECFWEGESWLKFEGGLNRVVY